MAGALDGLRVLDIATLYSAPLVAAMLGDLGADVIKVEVPGKENLEVPLFSGIDVNRLGMILRLGAAIKFILWGETG